MPEKLKKKIIRVFSVIARVINTIIKGKLLIFSPKER